MRFREAAVIYVFFGAAAAVLIAVIAIAVRDFRRG